MCHPHGDGEPDPREGVARRDVAIARPGGAMPARVCLPRGEAWGRVVIATDIFGANRFYKAIAERLAEAGCAAILPDLFFRVGGLPEVTREAAFARRARLDDPLALEDLEASLDRLREEVAAPPATLGFCLGGNYVFHLATRHDDLATVAYYGFPAGLPAEKGLAPPLDVAAAMQGPLLAFWGDQDEGVGMENVARFGEALAAAGPTTRLTSTPGWGMDSWQVSKATRPTRRDRSPRPPGRRRSPS